MAREPQRLDGYTTGLGRVTIAVLILFLAALFLVWRIDNPRIERLRIEVINATMPSFSWASGPATKMAELVTSYQSYQRLYEQNQELRRELRRMQEWREAARQLEEINARLLDLNNVQLDPKFTHVTGVVLADSGSPFRHSLLLNVGNKDGIVDGWATMDGLGLVGRISGVGDEISRVILLPDPASRIPIRVEPAGQVALLQGDSSPRPTVEFLDAGDQVRPGDRVVTSGDGGVFPPGLFVGHLTRDPSGRYRVRLAADFERLRFLRVVRSRPREDLSNPGSLVQGPPTAPEAREN